MEGRLWRWGVGEEKVCVEKQSAGKFERESACWPDQNV